MLRTCGAVTGRRPGEHASTVGTAASMTMDAPARRGVLFDVDGTLIDNTYVHTVAWWQAFRERGYAVRMSDIHTSIGEGSDQLLEELIGTQDPQVAAAHSRYYAPYLGQVHPFRGAPELLRATAAAGLTVVLASSVKSEEIDLLLEKLNTADTVTSVATSGDVDRTKPAPDPVQAAMTKGDLDASGAVMVGDTVWDVEAARRSGVECVAVCTGGWSRARLRQAGAVDVYEDAAALLADLDSSPIGRLARLSRGR